MTDYENDRAFLAAMKALDGDLTRKSIAIAITDGIRAALSFDWGSPSILNDLERQVMIEEARKL